MAQPFSLRYMLVDGQGNFGSIDGDSAAAMRYTEVRMAKIAHELLADLDKETVDYVPNYDGTEQIPAVLPTKVPNLLVNGASGIAVGMATNIPPHNLSEVIEAVLRISKTKPLLLMSTEYIQALIFQRQRLLAVVKVLLTRTKQVAAKFICDLRPILKPIKTAKTIIVTEIPYQVNKARLVEKIAELVKDKKVEALVHFAMSLIKTACALLLNVSDAVGKLY